MSGRIEGGQHDWIGYLQPVGLVVAPVVLTRLGLWPEPQGAADGDAVAAALAGGDRFALFRDVLGWPVAQVAGAPGGPPLPADLTRSLRDGETLLAPTYAVHAPGGGEAIQLLVRIEDDGIVLDRRGMLDGWEATAHQRFDRLLRETGVAAGILIGAGETGRKEAPLEPVLRLIVAPRGEAAGWMSWPLEKLSAVAGRGMLAGLKLLLDGHALFTGAPSHRLTTILADSRAAQATVSTRLAGQVLASLHELLRGFDAAAPDLVRELAAERPHHLYEGLLTVLLRLIFIAYAEDRDMMPSGEGRGMKLLYEQGYSLGGLHVRLGDDRAINPDTMDERFGAWGRLLALFRLVERGAGDFMQARGGKLFAEAAFPFLFGRAAPGDAERVLLVSDGCIARVLDGLLVLEGERVSYRALDVEQLGSVYETVMGFTVERAPAPMLAIRAGKGNRTPVWVDLAALAAAAGGDRVRLLKEWTGRGQFPAAVTKALRQANDIAALAAALAPIVDARAAPRGAAVAAGTPILQPTDERRRTGSHYTPRAMTEPIVAHALAPALARIGADATPGEVLDLKVCDPAVGSGAFLVEACRQLGARLVEAWERWPAQRPTIPADEDDLLHAKRLVAQHCLHGVDRNPLALDLAKLSLWLATLASRHEFSFLDHVLRAGDSLVGLPNPKIMAVTWGKMSGQHTFIEDIVSKGLRAAAHMAELMRREAEVAPYEMQQRRHEDATRARHEAHLVADAVLESFFAGSTVRERDRGLAEMQQYALSPSEANWAKLAGLRERLRASPIGITSFHWELEFNDVFARANPGFDAIVGNPPFAGKNTIASGHPLAYPDWLKTLHPGAHGNADLVAHFFRRAYGLLRRGGAMGLIATNTIRQGDTRETGLRRIVADGGVIYRAVSRAAWEGEAAVVVAQVFVWKSGHGQPPAPAMLDDRPVRRISAYLVEGDLDGSPARLRANAGKSSEGVKVYGPGFIFDPSRPFSEDNTLEAMQSLLNREPAASEIIRPFLGGEELVNDPRHRHCRYVIDFGATPADLAECRWPETFSLIRQRVKPYRDSITDEAAKRDWWLFQRRRETILRVFRMSPKGLAICVTSPHLSVAQVQTSTVFSNTAVILAVGGNAAFAILQSRVHEVWARFFASSMKDDLRYTPSDCFETFPLPPGYADAPALEAAGRAYHDHRAALMVARGQGMTPTYNRFHTRTDEAADIAELRRLHHAMDDAVLRAYGWDDLADRAAPQFLTEASEDDHRYQGRLFWPAPFRDALLARLLRLNEERAMAETML
jgi:hypothetical protein